LTTTTTSKRAVLAMHQIMLNIPVALVHVYIGDVIIGSIHSLCTGQVEKILDVTSVRLLCCLITSHIAVQTIRATQSRDGSLPALFGWRELRYIRGNAHKNSALPRVETIGAHTCKISALSTPRRLSVSPSGSGSVQCTGLSHCASHASTLSCPAGAQHGSG
jgi:hypothetical protein